MAVAYWNKMESTALVASVGNNGTVTGTPTFTAAVFGNGMSAPAAGDGCEFVLPAGFTFNKFSMAFWCQTQYAVTNGTSAVTYREFWHTTDNLVWMYLYNNAYRVGWDISLGGTNVSYIGFQPSWGSGEWHHHCVVFNKDGITGEGGKRLIYYIDSVEFGSSVAPHGGTQVGGGQTLRFGKYVGTSEPLAPYMMDNFRIYDDEITATQVYNDMTYEDGNPPAGGRRRIMVIHL